ncbi:hypothetical protein [Microbacterium natoriense]
MESRLISTVALSDCPVPPFTPPAVAAAVDDELTALRRRRARTVDHDVVADGDAIRVRLDGPTAFLTRENLPVVVGPGHFDDALERLLIGTPVGVSVTLAHPRGEVHATVLSAQGRELPPPSDGLISELTGEADLTLAGWRSRVSQRVRAARLDEHIDHATAEVLDAASELSVTVIADSDADAFVEAELERCRRLSAEEGLVFDEMTAAELEDRVAVDSIAGFIARAREDARSRITTALLGAHYSSRTVESTPADALDELLETAWMHARAHVENTLRSEKD